MRPLRSYDSVSGLYDYLSDVYSFGLINQTKKDQISQLQPGVRVLFAGCGSGREVVWAAAKGCKVTAIDYSQRMLDRLSAALVHAGADAELLCCDAKGFIRERHFDVICANFFLNCYKADEVECLVQSLLRSLASDGKFLIADVAHAQGSRFFRMANRIYLHTAMLPFWMANLVHWHANHNYEQLMAKLGLCCTGKTTFRLFGGPVVYQSNCFEPYQPSCRDY